MFASLTLTAGVVGLTNPETGDKLTPNVPVEVIIHIALALLVLLVLQSLYLHFVTATVCTLFSLVILEASPDH